MAYRTTIIHRAPERSAFIAWAALAPTVLVACASSSDADLTLASRAQHAQGHPDRAQRGRDHVGSWDQTRASQRRDARTRRDGHHHRRHHHPHGNADAGAPAVAADGSLDTGGFDAGLPPSPAVADYGPQVAALMQPLIDGEWLVGASVALIANGQTATFGHGRVRAGGSAPDGNTVFEIGSITKTFTSLLLADLVVEGRVTLEDGVASLLPAGTRVPDLNGRAITLLDLATHTSGLSRLPTNLLSSVDLDFADPYARYGTVELYEFLAGYVLPAEPGTLFEYSNLGGGLLGHALGLADGTSYAEAIERRVTRPLGMLDTAIALNDEQAERFAIGHDDALEPVAAWTFLDALQGGGALRSTADDMALYVAAQLAAGSGDAASSVSTPLARAMALTHAPQRPTGDAQNIGLGWFLATDTVLWHNGGTGGFRSIALLDSALGVGAVVLANTASDVVDALGFELLDLVSGRAADPLPLPPWLGGRPMVGDGESA